MNEFLLYLGNHASGFMVLISLIGAIVGGLWKLESQMKSHLNDFKVDMKAEIKQQITGLGTEISSMKTSIKKISKQSEGNALQIAGLKAAFETLQFSLTNFSGIAIKSSSPLSLTKFRKELSKHLKAEDLVLNYEESWQAHMNIKPDAHRLEIEDACFAFCEKKLLESISKKQAKAIRDSLSEI